MEILNYQFLHFTLLDLLDVLIVAFVIYKLLELVKGTRSAQMILGLAIILFAAILAYIFQLEGLKWLFSNLVTVGFIALVVVFQPEIRRALAQLGHAPLLGWFIRGEVHKTTEELAKGAIRLSELRYGGLIVVERGVGLKEFITTGRTLDAEVSEDLLTTLFTPYTPLHDGAVVVRGDRVVAAACMLPMTQNPRYSNLFGMRHRAAIGIAEESDAICIVVSEETGAISITQNGRFERDIPKLELKERLQQAFKSH